MSLYEHAQKPEFPRLNYDPAMDELEPPTPRREPPFKVTKHEDGYTYRFAEFLVITGHHALGKYAAISVWGQPVVLCDRKSIADLLRHNKKISPC